MRPFTVTRPHQHGLKPLLRDALGLNGSPQMRTDGELKIIQDLYDFILWMVGHIEKFPRHHRYSLGLALPFTRSLSWTKFTLPCILAA